jgi:hexokinase
MADIEKFLSDNGLNPAGIDARRCTNDFLAEMTHGLEGQPSSLAMIPTYIDTSRAVPRGRRVVALDAGGTNLRVATVIFDETGRARIENLTRHRMPGTDGEIDRAEFFRAKQAYGFRRGSHRVVVGTEG